MSQKSNKSAIGVLVALLAGVFVAKALWVGAELKYLPKQGKDLPKSSGVKKLYYHYNLASKKDKPKPIVKNRQPVVEHVKVVKKPKKPEEITKFSLKGLYNSKSKKVIIVQYKGQSYALSLHEELEGYRFIGLSSKYATFKKGAKRYKLELYKKEKKGTSAAQKSVENSSTPNQPPAPIVEQAQDTKVEPVVEGGTTYIPKDLFNKYKGDFRAIRRNIDAVPYMVNGKLGGFRISFVKKGSDFSKLGLKRGDILTAINGEALDNFKVPLEFFNNADTLNAATITIKRGNEIKELEYEVR